MTALFSSWPNKWYGCFANTQEEAAFLPLFDECTDVAWTPGDKCKIVDYLTHGPICVTSSAPPIPCDRCGSELPDQATWRWDGTWLWPNDLAHNVEFHSIRLPDQMVERIRSLDYTISDIDQADLDKSAHVLKEVKAILMQLP